MCNPVIFPLVADACAVLHSMEVENISHDIYGWDKIASFFLLARSVAFPGNEAKQELVDKIKPIELFEEFQRLQHCLQMVPDEDGGKNASSAFSEGYQFGLDVVFAHNDLLSGNILLPTGADNSDLECSIPGMEPTKVHIIDYEYAAYNYRAWDLANYFCGEWTASSDRDLSTTLTYIIM